MKFDLFTIRWQVYPHYYTPPLLLVVPYFHDHPLIVSGLTKYPRYPLHQNGHKHLQFIDGKLSDEKSKIHSSETNINLHNNNS